VEKISVMKNRNKLELYFLDLIKGKRRGIIALFLKFWLRFFSWIFKFIVLCRNWIFDQGWLRRYYPPVPMVISIGNIVAGGTGKTPVTLMLANEFYNEFTIAILSHGYRSQAERLSSPVILSKGEGPLHSAQYCGDEPYLISQNLPKAWVIVGKDRNKSSNMAARMGAQILVLDDGMQHRRLARDVEVIVMDLLDPFGQGYFLPRGLLRDSISSLKRADLIILNHVYDRERFAKVKEIIERYSKAPIVGTKMEVIEVFDSQNNAIASLKNRQVGIFCGIAHPEYFQHTIHTLGAQIIDSYFLPDHSNFESSALIRFVENTLKKGAEYIICTEKDRVKLEQTLVNTLPIAWVQMRLRLVEGDLYWKNFIEKAKTDLSKRI
jgi:tetraacyldisaccharide 4'-kinase